MNRLVTTLFLLLGMLVVSSAMAQSMVRIALLQYSGGGDWYANPTSLPNLIGFCNKELNMNLDPDPAKVAPSDKGIMSYPFIHMTGHGNVIFSDADRNNLRNYLKAGGFLHIDDNYGMDEFIRPQLKQLFPELELVKLPPSHPIFKKPYSFPKGLPKIHEHDNKPPEAWALFFEGRMIVLYTFECDLGDGWEDPRVHNDTEQKHMDALKMGANILNYVFLARDFESLDNKAK